jgi:uncharacterized protein
MTSAPQSVEQTHALIQAFFDAMEQADLARALSYCTLEASFTYMPTMVTPPKMPMRDALAFLFDTLFQLFPPPGLKLEQRRILVDATGGAIEYFGSGISATGAEFASPYAMHFDVSQGKISAVRSYTDTHQVFSKTQRPAPDQR